MKNSGAVVTPVLVAAAGILACGRADTPQVAEAARVDILAPADGDSVALPFTVRLSATGVEVVPATGQAEAGKGHHHLIIGGDVPTDDAPLPGPPQVVHLGTGMNEYLVDSLPAGRHRIIAVFASGDHVPMPSVFRDTVIVIVR